MNDPNKNLASSSLDSFGAEAIQSNANDWKVGDKKTRKTSKLNLVNCSANQSFNINENEKKIQINDVYNEKNIEIVQNLMSQSTKSVIILRGICQLILVNYFFFFVQT